MRSFSRNVIVKVVVFILTAVLLTLGVISIYSLGAKNDISFEHIYISEYEKSTAYRYELIDAERALYEYSNDYGAKSSIPEEFNYWFKLESGRTESNIDINELLASTTPLNHFYEDRYFSDNQEVWTGGYYSRDNADDNFVEVYSAFDAGYMADRQVEWTATAAAVRNYALFSLVLVCIALLLSIYSVVVTGRKPEDNELHKNIVDRVYTDIAIGGLVALCFGYYAGFYGLYAVFNGWFRGTTQLVMIAVLTFIFCVILGAFLLSFVRKIKGRCLIKHSLIYTVLHFLYKKTIYRMFKLLKSLFDGRAFAKYPLTKALFYRQLVFICSSAFLMFWACIFSGGILYNGYGGFFVLIFIILILEAIIMYWYLTANNKTFEDINKGFNDSLEEQMKSERMKINLVTNVSHDLKTPLTSIISYVDLLSKEENLSQNAIDYIAILAQKSDRLKHIVSDLFELAKVTSGDISLELEQLDIKKLVEQTLADMDDKISGSGFQIKTKLPESKVMIMGDGKKLYRVLQNIIDNALKYSLDGTRIYVELTAHESKTNVTVKSTSATEMDFTAEEILQRFNRGDKSRSTDGNGLGLSIAQGLTTACGGELTISIDGDLFKVNLSFNALSVTPIEKPNSLTKFTADHVKNAAEHIKTVSEHVQSKMSKIKLDPTSGLPDDHNPEVFGLLNTNHDNEKS